MFQFSACCACYNLHVFYYLNVYIINIIKVIQIQIFVIIFQLLAIFYLFIIYEITRLNYLKVCTRSYKIAHLHGFIIIFLQQTYFCCTYTVKICQFPKCFFLSLQNSAMQLNMQQSPFKDKNIFFYLFRLHFKVSAIFHK